MTQRALRLFAPRPTDQHMRRVAYCGVVKRKRHMLVVARRLRRERPIDIRAGPRHAGRYEGFQGECPGVRADHPDQGCRGRGRR